MSQRRRPPRKPLADQNLSVQHFTFDGFSIDAPRDWCEITHEVDAPDPPITLAKDDDGIGALQFTVGLCRAGPKPNPTSGDLAGMIREFASDYDLGDAIDEFVDESDRLTLAAASFRARGDFIRAWYVSDGSSFAKITYTCAEDDSKAELHDCDSIVRTLTFR